MSSGDTVYGLRMGWRSEYIAVTDWFDAVITGYCIGPDQKVYEAICADQELSRYPGPMLYLLRELPDSALDIMLQIRDQFSGSKLLEVAFSQKCSNEFETLGAMDSVLRYALWGDVCKSDNLEGTILRTYNISTD